MQKPPSKRGLARIWAAFFNSISGLKSCYRSEEAFKQEAILFVILLAVIAVLPAAPVIKLMLIGVNSFVLIVELLNSAIEAVVDKASPEYDTLAGQAKDMGSAAVLLSLLLAAMVWAWALYTVFC
jgi:diacylglycerol kinase (ATP)